MSNEEYLASGILELYAAGGLSQAEREEVEQRAAHSPEIGVALEEACAAMEGYARLYAVAPRPALKNRILDQLQGNTLPASAPIAASEAEPAASTETRHYTLPPAAGEAAPYKWLFAASIVLFLISGLLCFHFYAKWQQAEERLATVVASEQLMAQNAQTASLRTQQLEQALNILRDPGYQAIRLEGVEAHKGASMLVYWSPQKQEVYIDQISLPAPPAGKQYQLWALDQGTPVDAGLLPKDNREPLLQKMKSIRSAQAFAVTLEPEGGSAQPTLDQLMVMGKIKA